MADVHDFSERVIDLAQRLEDVADAANGKGNRGGGGIGAKWLLLPAAGAGAYALITNNAIGRRAKGVIDQAKTRAAELPDDLMNRARQASRPQGSRSASASSTANRSRSSGRSSGRKSPARKSASSR
jgi:hypothetical protein